MENTFEQKKLGEILTEAEIITNAQLEKALQVQTSRNKRLGQILVSLGYTDEDIVLSLLGKKLNTSYVKLSEYGNIEPEIIRSIPEGIARRNMLIPLEKDARTLTVAMADPQNNFVRDILHLMTGFNIKPCISSEREIQSAIDDNYKHLRVADSQCLPLNQLGFDSSTLATYKKYIEVPSGLVLIAGPGNSGKSTTLYSTLNALNFPDANIISLEESIECILDGVNQVEVKPELGFNFQCGLRTCLNSLDADVIVVGEVKDVQTARLAINAADTGHSVIAVIDTDELAVKERAGKNHVSGAEAIIEFLANIGIEPYLIASAVKMIVTQKLMRSICPECKEVHAPSMDLLEGIGIKMKEDLRLYRGQGCKACNYTGFNGYTVCFEVLAMNDKIRNMVIEGSSSGIIRQAALDSGMIAMQRAGINKVLRGETTIDEMLRVVDITESRQLKSQEPVISSADEFYWNIFEKTGSIDAFLMYKGSEMPEETFKTSKIKKTSKMKPKKAAKKKA
ncbi:MAG: ATPase, T2SS/T4P/T4SS family [bacterium]